MKKTLEQKLRLAWEGGRSQQLAWTKWWPDKEELDEAYNKWRKKNAKKLK